MIEKLGYRQISLLLGIYLLIIAGMSACQSQPESIAEVAPSDATSPAIQSDGSQPGQDITQDSSDQPSTSDQSPGNPAATNPPMDASPDPAVIEASWQSSPHADSYVLDPEGQNNTCARCHAPINWLPSMDTLPESCFACKFELEDPPPFIAESDWTDIPCNVCHELDKNDIVQPEYAWLEIAPLGEYAAVASPTELCLKCHAPVGIQLHGSIQLVSAHADYQCTECHSAHDTTASCLSADCHSDVIELVNPIPGHDADHQTVSCVACHDGSGMDVGPDEQTGLWTTFTSPTAADGDATSFAFTSHNVVLDARCDRCHFANNPWALSDAVTLP